MATNNNPYKVVNMFHHKNDGASVLLTGNKLVGYTLVRRYPTKQKRKTIVVLEKNIKVAIELYNEHVKETNNRENIVNVKKKEDAV